MEKSKHRLKQIFALLLFLGVIPVLVSAQSPRRPASLEEKANAALGLRASRVVQLTIPARPANTMNVRIPLERSEIILNLYVHSIRAPRGLGDHSDYAEEYYS